MTLTASRTRLVVGLIAMVTAAAMSSLLVIAANGEFGDDYQLTATTARTGFGLDDTSDVKIRGIKVGTVDHVDLLDDGTVQLTLNIAKEIAVPADATATIEPLSVFGPKFVDIKPGPNEATGPFHAPGDSMGAIVAPTELAETLDGVADLLTEVDADDIATIVSELARGLDGLGPTLGDTIDASIEVASLLDAKRSEIESLVTDAESLAATIAARPASLRTIAVEGQDTLRTLAAEGDALGDLLTGLGELSVRADDLIAAVGPDLDSTLIGLERGAHVLNEQLRFIPDFVDGLDAVTALLGTGLLQWDRGDDQWGAIGHFILDFEPCAFLADASCPPRPGYEP